MENKERFIDPFELPKDLDSNPKVINDQSMCYDMELHDSFDWLAQPCVGVPYVKRQDGQANES